MTGYQVIPGDQPDDPVRLACEDGHVILLADVDQHTAEHGSTGIELSPSGW